MTYVTFFITLFNITLYLYGIPQNFNTDKRISIALISRKLP